MLFARRFRTVRITEHLARAVHKPPRRRLLRIDCERTLRHFARFLCQRRACAVVGHRECLLKQHFGQFVQDTHIDREVERTLARTREVRREHALETLRSLREVSVLLVDEGREVRDRPRRLHSFAARWYEERSRVVESTLADREPRASQRTNSRFKRLNARERFIGLSQRTTSRAPVTLAEEPNAVVVPTLPLGNRIGRGGRLAIHATILTAHRQHDFVARKHHHGVVVDARRAFDETQIGRVEFAIAHFALDAERRRRVRWNFEKEMRDITRAWRNLVVVEREENVLRIASIDAISLAINDERVEHARPRIEFAGCLIEAPTHANDAHVEICWLKRRTRPQPNLV